jgi:hypothetical protein
MRMGGAGMIPVEGGFPDERKFSYFVQLEQIGSGRPPSLF